MESVAPFGWFGYRRHNYGKSSDQRTRDVFSIYVGLLSFLSAIFIVFQNTSLLPPQLNVFLGIVLF